MSAEKIEKALDIILHYAGIEGERTRAWTLDQVVRTLTGDVAAYRAWVDKYCEGVDGPDTYEWDDGSQP